MADDTVTELTTRDFTDTTIAHDSIGGGRHRLRVVVYGDDDVNGDWYGARELAHITHEGVDFIGFHPVIAKQLGTSSDLHIFLVDEGDTTP